MSQFKNNDRSQETRADDSACNSVPGPQPEGFVLGVPRALNNGAADSLTYATPLGMSVPEAAKAVGISTRKMWDLVGDGIVPSRRIGRRVVVPFDGLRTWFEGVGQ